MTSRCAIHVSSSPHLSSQLTQIDNNYSLRCRHTKVRLWRREGQRPAVPENMDPPASKRSEGSRSWRGLRSDSSPSHLGKQEMPAGNSAELFVTPRQTANISRLPSPCAHGHTYWSTVSLFCTGNVLAICPVQKVVGQGAGQVFDCMKNHNMFSRGKLMRNLVNQRRSTEATQSHGQPRHT